MLGGMTGHSLLPCLCFHTWCWKASETPSIWIWDVIPSRAACCRWHFIAMLFWTVQNKELPPQTVLVLQSSFLASGSQQSGLAASPNPFSGPPRCIPRDWDCLKTFEQDISVSEKKMKFDQDYTLLWGKKRDFVGIFCRENARW